MKDNKANRLAQRVITIKQMERGTVSSIVSIGRELIEAEKECGHGKWATWLNKNFKWSVRTALRYRKVAEFCAACDDGAYGPDVTLGDMDMLQSPYPSMMPAHALHRRLGKARAGCTCRRVK